MNRHFSPADFLFLISLLSLTAGNAIRMKRDLLDLADMFETAFGLDPTEYAPYGNWCGYGGSGIALDAIDSCCEKHDNCYDEAAKDECPDEQVHVVQYTWDEENSTVVCDTKQTKCQIKVCECDREIVECIWENKHVYSEKHRYARYDN